MMHVFIINPVAGKGKLAASVAADIERYFRLHGGAYRLEYTKAAGDATAIARSYAQTGEPVRLYACGGDGTLHEVVNGVVGFSNVELGVIPCGTGNDYCASFGEKHHFFDIEAQVKGSAIPVDLIECEGIYSINQCSMGFDAQVAGRMEQLKNKPVIGGRLSYVSALVVSFFGRLGNRMTIDIDGQRVERGDFLFTIAAKGQYHGGGFRSAPMANPSDGRLNFMMVRKIGHLRCMSLLPKYVKGNHLCYTDLVINCFGSQLHVRTQKPLPITMDGELIYSEDFCANLVREGARFIVPATITVSTSVPLRKVASA